MGRLDDVILIGEFLSASTTPFSSSQTASRLLLGIVLLLTVISVGVTSSPYRMGFAHVDRGDPADVDGYQGAIERMRQGDTYYEALGAELLTRGYPTVSPFNWRLPTTGVFLASVPEPDLGRILLAFIGAGLLFFGFQTLTTMGGSLTVGLGLVLLSGPVLPGLVGILYVQPVLWAGMLVALSVVLRGAGHLRWSVAVGILAPFFREFAIAYVVVCLGFALLEQRRKEAYAWAAGVAGFCVILAYHAWQVGRHLAPESFAQPEGWLQFGGLPFVISTFQMSGYLLLLPQWAAALFFVASLVGLVGWTSPLGRRVSVTMAVFVMSFAVVGLPYNQYWGLIFAPLACLAAARAPAVLGGLWRAAELPVPAGSGQPDGWGAQTAAAEYVVGRQSDRVPDAQPSRDVDWPPERPAEPRRWRKNITRPKRSTRPKPNGSS